MIIVSTNVHKTIFRYASYLIQESMCSYERTIEKIDSMYNDIMQNIGGIITHRISPYKQFGNPQGYRLYVYKDSRSKSQWGFAYEKLPNGDVVICGMTNMKLIKESDELSRIMSLMERIDNIYK